MFIDLIGWSTSYGGSASAGAMIGGDALRSNGEITGVQLLIGGSVRALPLFEGHRMDNYTVLLYSWKMGNTVANTIRGVYEMLKFYGFDV